jgi:hypothetical protein
MLSRCNTPLLANLPQLEPVFQVMTPVSDVRVSIPAWICTLMRRLDRNAVGRRHSQVGTMKRDVQDGATD